MFDDTVVVQSAVSAFNNAALAGPAFLWWALLALPVFALVFFCGNAFLEKIGWTKSVLTQRISQLVIIFTFMWLILFSGGYGVLRDSITVLPFVLAGLYFVIAFFVGNNSKAINFQAMNKKTKTSLFCLICLLLFVLGLSDLHAWWGPLLQIGAVLSGALLGRLIKKDLPVILMTLLIILATTVVILMQPEFFRFGQLGNLTVFHLLGLVMTGVFCVATFVSRNIKPSAAIKHGAYVKIKWLLRVMTVLVAALFLFTESVPLFFALLGMVMLLVGISIWHLKTIPENLSKKLYALSIMAFGVLTVMPVITAAGILYWVNNDCQDIWNNIKRLL